MPKPQSLLRCLAGLASLLLVASACSNSSEIAFVELSPGTETASNTDSAPAVALGQGGIGGPIVAPSVGGNPAPQGTEILPPVVMEMDPAPTGTAPADTSPTPAGPAAVVAQGPNPPAANAPEATPPSAAPAPAAAPAAGFPNLQLQLNSDPANQPAVDNYSPGISTCAAMLESVLVRDPQAGPSSHAITVSVENLNPDARGGFRTAGIAITPTPASYDAARQGQLALALDVALQNQYNVCTTFVHETLHTMTVGHVGSGLMAPTISEGTFLDKPISDDLKRVGYQFIPALQAQLDNNQQVPLAAVIASYTNSSQAQLLAQSA